MKQRRNLLIVLGALVIVVCICLAVVVAIVLAVVLWGGGGHPEEVEQAASDGAVEQAARQAIDEWAQSRQIPCRILHTRVLSNDGNSARVAVFGATQEEQWQIAWTPREATVEVRNVGGQWNAQPVQGFESPFTAVVLSAEIPGGRCLDNYLPGSTPDEGYPCIRLTNTGNFDWEWDRLHWGGLCPASNWGDSWTAEVNLPSGSSVDLAYWETWGEFQYDCIGLDEEENEFLVIQLPVP